MQLLRQELSTQVLADGGHEERSASYHLLILARLVELGCIEFRNGQRPSWLISSIESMATWAKCAIGGWYYSEVQRQCRGLSLL